MNTITHALLPVIAAAIANKSYNPPQTRRNIFTGKQILLIGIAGAAPDLLNPHLSLAARYASWSHSLIFFIPLTIAIITLSLTTKKLKTTLALWLISAYALHLFCDAIAGGIAYAYPLNKNIIGSYIVEPTYWIPIDVICILTTYFLVRAIPNLRKNHLNF